MNDDSPARPVTPSSTRLGGHTCLTYPLLEAAWLVHGTVVFRDPVYGGPGKGWREIATRFMADNVVPEPRKIFIPDQVHGNHVMTVGAGAAAGAGGAAGAEAVSGGDGELLETPVCDGLVTSRARVLIGVNTADCIPLVAVDAGARVIGVAHCGWRGIAAGVVESLVREMRAASAGRPGSSGAGSPSYVIGPSVGGCCYEVGADLLRSFSGREAGICASVRGGRTFFDLRQLVVLRLLDQGIDRAAVFTDNTCTSCASETLCSYRAQGEACGRMYTFLMIKA